MNKSQFRRYIEYYEYYQQEHPLLFKARVITLLMIGYSYLFFILGVFLFILYFSYVFLVLGGNIFFFIIFLPTLALIIQTVRAILRIFMVRIPKPKGVEVTEKNAPQLFKLVDYYQKSLKTSKIHKILVNNEMNAFVVQRPKLGAFGWHTNYLVIGMPLLMALSAEQFQSVLTHEMGHISHSHGKFGNFVSKTSQAWDGLMDSLCVSTEYGSFFYRSFFVWFITRLEAYSFILKRVNEYEADKRAVSLTSSIYFAEALGITGVIPQYMKENFWKEYYRKSIEYEKPYPLYAYYKEFFLKGIPDECIWQLYSELQNIPTMYINTHPSYSDRILALNQKPVTPALAKTTAAESIFAVNVQSIMDELEREWQKEIADKWALERKNRLKAKEKLIAPVKNVEKWEAGDVKAYNKAYWSELVYGLEYAYPLYYDVLSINSLHPQANLEIGRKLILRGEQKGMELIEKAVERNPDCIIQGVELIYDYLNRQGRIEEAERYSNTAESKIQYYHWVEYSRRNLVQDDVMTGHDLSSKEIEILRNEILSKFKFIHTIYLLKKDTERQHKENIYVMYIKTRRPMLRRKKALNEFIESMGELIPEYMVFMDLRKSKDRRFKRRLKEDFEHAKIV